MGTQNKKDHLFPGSSGEEGAPFAAKAQSQKGRRYVQSDPVTGRLTATTSGGWEEKEETVKSREGRVIVAVRGVMNDFPLGLIAHDLQCLRVRK